MTDHSMAEPIRTAERLTASETKSLDVVVSVPAQMTNEPVAPTASPGTQGTCLLSTSDAADERSRVDLGGRRLIKKKTRNEPRRPALP